MSVFTVSKQVCVSTKRRVIGILTSIFHIIYFRADIYNAPWLTKITPNRTRESDVSEWLKPGRRGSQLYQQMFHPSHYLTQCHLYLRRKSNRDFFAQTLLSCFLRARFYIISKHLQKRKKRGVRTQCVGQAQAELHG